MNIGNGRRGLERKKNGREIGVEGRGIEDIWERNRTEEERNRGIGVEGRGIEEKSIV